MPNIGIGPDTHLLETLLYFAPNNCQIVYMEPQSLLSPLASPHRPSLPPLPPLLPAPPPPPPPPPLYPPATALAFLLLPGASCPPLSPPPPFRCSLLIVVCPRHCHCRRLCRLCHLCRRCRLCLAISLPEVIDMIVVVANVIIVILVVVPVVIVDNDAMPGPCRSLCRRSLPSLLSRCFLAGVSAAQRRPLLPPSMWPLLPLPMRSLFPQLLPLTSRHGHDLLLQKNLF